MRQRVLTAALLIPPVLLAVFIDHFAPLYVLALMAYGIGALELGRIGRSPGVGVSGFILLAMVPLAVARLSGPVSTDGQAAVQHALRLVGISSALLSLLGAGAAVLIATGRRGFLLGEIASWWLAAGLMAALVLHGWSSTSASPGSSLGFAWGSSLLLALIPIWVGDTLAIFAGKAFGKRPLAPRISPKKTVEGGAANLAGCVVAAAGVASLIGHTLVVGLLAGLATGVFGQAGDLLESAMKRAAGLKDSGALLPGHGGLLDRIDSILLSAPAVALVVTLGPVHP